MSTLQDNPCSTQNKCSRKDHHDVEPVAHKSHANEHQLSAKTPPPHEVQASICSQTLDAGGIRSEPSQTMPLEKLHNPRQDPSPPKRCIERHPSPSPSPDEMYDRIPCQIRRLLHMQRTHIDNATRLKEKLPEEERRLMKEVNLRYEEMLRWLEVAKTMADREVQRVIAAAHTRADEAITEANDRLGYLQTQFDNWRYRRYTDDERDEDFALEFDAWMAHIKPIEVCNKSTLKWKWHRFDVMGEIVGVPPNSVRIVHFICEPSRPGCVCAVVGWVADEQTPVEAVWVSIATEHGNVRRTTLMPGEATMAMFAKLPATELVGQKIHVRICAGNKAGFGEMSECITTVVAS